MNRVIVQLLMQFHSPKPPRIPLGHWLCYSCAGEGHNEQG